MFMSPSVWMITF